MVTAVHLLRKSNSSLELFGYGRSSLGETLEPFEGVVDEDPVLVGLPGVVVRWRHWNEVDQNTPTECVWFLTNFEGNIREVIKVGGIIYRLDLHWDGSGSLPDVSPVDPPEPVQALDVVDTLEPLVSLITEPEHQH